MRNIPIAIPVDTIIHTAENGYECDDADCICHWEQRTDELDETGTHPPDCRCSWCEPEERSMHAHQH